MTCYTLSIENLKKRMNNLNTYSVSLEERPESIHDRSEYGHGEIDTVLLTEEKRESLLTLTERKIRLEIIRLIPDKTTQSVNQD